LRFDAIARDVLRSSCAGLTRLRGRSRFGKAKARASIIFAKAFL
jgi:hypothetical protein